MDIYICVEKKIELKKFYVKIYTYWFPTSPFRKKIKKLLKLIEKYSKINMLKNYLLLSFKFSTNLSSVLGGEK